MTEADWLASENPGRMLDFVTENPDHEDITCVRSPRKLRLFACACACCRLVWDGLTDSRVRRAVEVAGRYADGEATGEELSVGFGLGFAGNPLLWPAGLVSDLDAGRGARGMLGFLAARNFWENAVLPLAAQAALIRCVFGNPYRPARLREECAQCDGSGKRGHCERCRCNWDKHGGPCVTCDGPLTFKPCATCAGSGWVGTFDEAWLAHGGGVVRRLAEAAYRGSWAWVVCPACDGTGRRDGRPREACRACGGPGRVGGVGLLDPHRLAVLADALGEAGCTDAGLLAHLRGPGPHARGCWPVDLLLGKA